MHQVIIETQSNPLTFERFCAALFSLEENTTISTTSSNYDRGVDAKSLQGTRQSYPLVLCVTLAKELDPKVTADILKLLKRKPDAIYYCSSQRLTEDACTKLENEIRGIINSTVRAKVYGSIQIARISENHPEVLKHYFAAELESITSALASPAETLDKEAKSLRLALLAFGSDEAEALRNQISMRLLMDVLTEGPVTSGQIAAKITSDLSLPTSLSKSYVEQLLQKAALNGIAEFVNKQWRLTAVGSQEAQAIPVEATENLLEGRKTVRRCLESLLGTTLSDQQYEQVWSTLLDGLADLFYTNGLRLISALSSFLDVTDVTPITSSSDKSLEEIAAEIAQRIESIFSSEELKKAVSQGIRDIFTERNGAAFDWLSRVCERFVALCSLGLESSSSDEIRKLIKRTYISLDTDIVITFLASGEPDHESVRDFLTRFRELGGRIMLSAAVLEEVAYHAWISQKDFEGTRFMLGKLGVVELRRFCENAFVRAFHALAKAPNEAEFWPDYINGFRGATAYDYSKIQLELTRNLGIEILQEPTDHDLQEAITKEVLQMRNNRAKKAYESKEKEGIDKAQRDGRVLASIQSGRDAQARLGTNNTVILISSSGRLRSAGAKFKKRFGAPDPVLSIGAISYLISLIPNSKLGAETLRRSLFEFGESGHLQDHERLALRVIRGTGLYKLPWATRGMLSNRLESTLYAEAKKRDVSVDDFKKDFARADPKTDPALIIATAVSNASYQTNLEAEVRELRRQLEETQLQLEFAKQTKSPYNEE